MAEIKNRSLSEEFLIEIDKIIDYILCNDKFVVTSHINPDGDNIGSSLAMCGFLEALDKEYIYLLDDAYPSDNIIDQLTCRGCLGIYIVYEAIVPICVVVVNTYNAP
mgnify:CR=1 FL=1